MNQQALSALIWSVADLLRGDFKQSEYGRVILPFTVLRRLDCVLLSTKQAALDAYQNARDKNFPFEELVKKAAQQNFYNISKLTLQAALGDTTYLLNNLESYIKGFSRDVQDIFEKFKFLERIDDLHHKKLLYQVTEKFVNVDLHPFKVDNFQMGLVFEELIRKFAELSNETAGEHFTPREVIRLMVSLLFIEDDDALQKPGTVRTIYDPTAGTGGMLSVADEHLHQLNDKAASRCSDKS